MTSAAAVFEACPATQTARTATKRRAEWIEITRVFATWIVVMTHVEYTATFDVYEALFVGARVPFFFFISGFLTRTKSADEESWFNWRRAGLLALPYAVWQLAMILGCLFNLFDKPEISWATIGDWRVWIRYFIHYPVDGPLWFVRDLVFLSLISPLLLKFRSSLCYLAVAIWVLDDAFGPHPFFLPRSWGSYILGLGLSNFSADWLGAQFKRVGWNAVLLAAILTLSVIYFQKGMRVNSKPLLATMYHGASYGAAVSIIGVLALGRVSIWIEECFPRLSRRLANLGISSFLVYAGHYPILLLLKPTLDSININNPAKWSVLSYIFPILILLVAYTGWHLVYLFLHRYLPWSLPYVAARRVPGK